MAKISTKALFNEYYETEKGKRSVRSRGQVDRLELYEYESKIGKEFLDFTADEIADMLLTCRHSRIKGAILTRNALYAMKSVYSDVLDYYKNKYEPDYKNPFDDSERLKNIQTEYQDKTKDLVLNREIVDGALKLARECQQKDTSVNAELFMRLSLAGFDINEMYLLQKEDVDIQNRVAHINDREVKLSDELAIIMLQNQTLEDFMANGRIKMVYTRYKGSFIRFAVRESKLDKFDEADNAAKRHRVVAALRDIFRDTEYDFVTVQGLYDYGLYAFMIDRFGKEKAEEYITSTQNSPLMIKAFMDYGIPYSYKLLSLYKHKLKGYIE